MRHVVESPIEIMLLAELYRRQDLSGLYEVPDSAVVARVGPRLGLSTQVEVSTDAGDYRLDIVVEASGVRVGVECDGAAFHGSDEQAAMDRVRDEALRRAGWTIVRFTGAEILRDFLASGPKPKRDVVEAAGKVRLARRTVERAFTDLGLVSTPDGKERLWSLP